MNGCVVRRAPVDAYESRLGRPDEVWPEWYAQFLCGRIADTEGLWRGRTAPRRAGGGSFTPVCDRVAGQWGDRGQHAVREHRSTQPSREIGWTWVAPRWQRTAINTEAKPMLLRHAFETLGCIRVEFKTDRLNEQSRTALKRIGAVEEGEHPRRGVARHPGDTGGGFESACRSGPAPVARRPCESRNVTNDQTAKCQGCRTLAPIKSKPRKGIRLALAGVPLGKSGGKWGGPWRESSMSAGRRSGADRRDNGRRNSEERRRQVIPVAVERRSGIDRRMELDRRTGMDRRVISDRRQALRPPSRERARV